MRFFRYIIFLAIVVLVVYFIINFLFFKNKLTLVNLFNKEISYNMEILSPAFENNKKIPSLYTCDGANINPPLIFKNIPPEAKSLVLIVDDPDAPMGVWNHWTVFNIPPYLNEILEGQEPEGLKGLNSFKKLEYGGPCPPTGEHRYFFKLYALDVILNLPEGVSKAEIEKEMKNHIISQAQLIGLYSR